MRPSRRDIVIATRRSALAMAQSESIGRRLARLNPRVAMRLLPLESEGDRVTDRPLASLGGKGLFTRSVERALLDGRADIAVHSLKDLPTEPTPGLTLAAIPTRAAVHDVLICRDAHRLQDLPGGAKVGTCSPRRQAQLLRLRGDLVITPLRGNVETRVKRVIEEGLYQATLLAAAGLGRLNLAALAGNAIALDQMLPAAGQGALAIQCRADDHVSLRRCLPLNDPDASLAVHCERSVVAALGADCHSPVAVLAEVTEGARLRIRARVLSPDGSVCLEADEGGTVKGSRKVSDKVARALLDAGARRVLSDAGKPVAATHA